MSSETSPDAAVVSPEEGLVTRGRTVTCYCHVIRPEALETLVVWVRASDEAEAEQTLTRFQHQRLLPGRWNANLPMAEKE